MRKLGNIPIELVPTASLIAHPSNLEIYGNDEDVSELAEQIKKSQWIKHIVVTPKNVIISGHRRWRAARLLGMKEVPIERRTFAGELDELEALLLENATREKTAEQKVREAAVWHEIEASKARMRKVAGKHIDATQRVSSDNDRLDLPGNCPEGSNERYNPVGNCPEGSTKGEAREIVAKRVGLGSGRTYERAAKAVEVIDKHEAAGKPELAQAMRKVLNEESIGAAEKVAKKSPHQQEAILQKLASGEAKTVQQAERITRTEQQLNLIGMMPEPKGKYSVLVVDPSWPYELRDEDDSHRGKMPYPKMSLEQIQQLKIPELTQRDAVLWLWTTNGFMHEAFHLVEQWGFIFKTLMTWMKPRFGLGNYLRNQTEHCLVAVKGRPTFVLTNQSTALQAPAREHSRKPDEFYQLVDSLCPGSKCELFAREQRRGWTCFGAEIGVFAPPASEEDLPDPTPIQPNTKPNRKENNNG